jgi:hypothetical protein
LKEREREKVKRDIEVERVYRELRKSEKKL